MDGENRLDIKDEIRELIEGNNVTLFMKGNKRFPQCGFSANVVEILKEHGVKFADVNVFAREDLREGVKRHTSWPTLPQLYVKGKLVGGHDKVTELHESGELVNILESIVTKPTD